MLRLSIKGAAGAPAPDPQEFLDPGEQFEAKEEKLFGKDGFERVVAQVADLEKRLGIYQLSQFTPKL